MNSRWSIAALLCCTLVAGCSADPTPEVTETPQGQPADGAEEAAAPAAAPQTSPGPVGVSAAPVSRPSAVPAPGASSNRTSSGNAPAAVAPAPRPQWREVTLAANTPLALELTTALSSETTPVETPVRARLRSAVVVDGATVIPAGATLLGEVAEVQRAGRVQGRSRLVLRFSQVQMDGEREAIRTNPVVFEGEATRGEDATKIGVGAGIGAAIGGILGGGSGAANGAAIGGAAGTGAVLATRGREVELASGAQFEATLATPANLRVSVR